MISKHEKNYVLHEKIIPENLETINRSFAVQALDFDSKSVNFTKKEYLDYIVNAASPAGTDTVLEVAAGTCACGRAFAPLVQTVVCLDLAAPMLQVGKQDAQENHLDNMVFVKGYAEELPFLDNSFDIVLSRLAFHHFTDTDRVFREMVRVLKPGGKLILIDMEAADESLRKTEDEIEVLRDPSHVKNLSWEEMLKLYSDNSLVVEKSEITEMPVHLSDWLEPTKTAEAIRNKIIEKMENDISGKEKTGFNPYETENGICFNQRWVLTLGKKFLS